MNINNFAEGMEVVVAEAGTNGIDLSGFVGTVIGFELDRNLVCVRFEDVPENLRDELHTCKGRCEYGHGWMLDPSAIVPLPDTDTEFEPADPGDKCDFTGKPADYKAGELRFSKVYAGLVKKCAQCGGYHYLKDLRKDSSGEFYCDPCIAENGWKVCSDCGEILRDSSLWVMVNKGTTEERVVCTVCISNGNYLVCEDCGNYYSGANISIHSRGIAICTNCAPAWTTCRDCGMPIRRLDENIFNGEYYCERCNPERIAIHNYSFKPAPRFYGLGDLYMGVELEIDRGEDPEETASEIKCKQIYCKHDGSLEDNGVEIVTHPCSLEYHTHELGWEQVINVARSHDYESHNAGTCGLHVHVNRTFFGETFDTQELNISKVIILVQRFWEQIVMFSRRRRGDINHWAKKPYADFKKEDSTTETFRKMRREKDGEDRYRAINLQNSNTIEFRMYRGTLKLNTLLATLQFTDGICRYAKNHSMDEMYDVTWEDFISDECFAYDELQSYFKERNLLA